MCKKIILNNKYQIIKNIGEGTFSKVFLGKNIKTGEEIAIKIQHNDVTNILKYEARIYKYLRDVSGIPVMRNYGTDQGFNYLVIDYLDKTLDKYDLDHKRIIELLPEAINIIEHIHNLGIIHRDIKPDNFLIKSSTRELYLIDFGLSKLYIDKNKKHIDERRDRKLIGTSKYSSLNVHYGIEASRRDDIESLCYTFIMLFSKSLPWSNINHKEYKEIQYKKERSLKWMNNTPGEFITLLLYARKLKFEEKPNYSYINNLFINLVTLY